MNARPLFATYLPLHSKWFADMITTGEFRIPLRPLFGHLCGEVNAFAIGDAQSTAADFYALRGYTIVNGLANRLFRDVFRLTPCGSGRRLYALDPLSAMRERWALHYPEARFNKGDAWVLREVERCDR